MEGMVKYLLLCLVAITLAAIAIDADLNGYAKVYPPELPIVNPPVTLRQRNWVLGSRENGSCMWASTITLLRWQEQYALADRLRRTRGGGELPSQFAKRLNTAGVKHVAHSAGSAAFLEWACLTRHGAVIVIGGKGDHAVNVVHMDESVVYLLDNNQPREYQVVPRDEFLRNWKKAGGWAFVPLYNPAAPLP